MPQTWNRVPETIGDPIHEVLVGFDEVKSWEWKLRIHSDGEVVSMHYRPYALHPTIPRSFRNW